MSIFRETFPKFIQDELKRRQDGMATRNPAFLQQLNTRNAWVRMTSGVNTLNASGTAYNNDLASKYVLQGGVLNSDKLRAGLGKNGTSTYDIFSPGGSTENNKHRLGIRPMPGITNISIQSKGAYGSLQEATVSFNCWDIRQLEDLELLYMRPGYTVLLEFGWDFAKASNNGVLPKYDILNAKEGISINEAFADIYQKIEQSKGTYDALLGYVTNYSWVARDDGGYDCSTTIISLGEVLESLKANWVPMETKAFDRDKKGLLNLNLPLKQPAILNSYELGIIPGLLHEIWWYLRTYKDHISGNFSAELKDPVKGTKYQLAMSETLKGVADKFNRGGLPKPLGTVVDGIEGWITLGSFCDLLNNYVLLKDQNNNPLVQITTYETDNKGNISDTSLKCIASPLSISTNLGVCLVRNDNWASLGAKKEKSEAAEDKKSTTTPLEKALPSDLKTAFRYRWFRNKPASGIRGNVAARFESKTIPPKSVSNPPADTLTQEIIEEVIELFTPDVYTYRGGYKQFQEDLEVLVLEILNVSDVKVLKDNKFQIIVENTYKFNSQINTSNTFNLFDYLYNKVDSRGNTLKTNKERAEAVYSDLFSLGPNGTKTIDWGEGVSKTTVIGFIEKTLSSFDISKNPNFYQNLQSKLPEVAQNVAEEAKDTLITKNTLQFLDPETNLRSKTLGNISDIYVNINYLYSQAISRNIASNDNQNTNTISIREYIQTILRDIQNSLGNINQFDIQVDERNAIGRIVDLNFTGDPNQTLFTLQLHNTNSIVRDYGFQSKIFPEMGSIIAISAQDTTGIGKLGYDNATLVAWNEGVRDRLIPKKTFTSDISIDANNPDAAFDPVSFILPFLTKMNQYFEAIKGQDIDNINIAFGGLDVAYRDFLANLSRFDRRNNFKTIIPTTLDVTLDGIGGMVIGNLFQINQDIVPKGYKSVEGRRLAYIVTGLSHEISENDWVTRISSYPIVFEDIEGENIANKWDNQEYPGSLSITIGGRSIPVGGKSTANPDNLKDTVNFFLNKGYKDFQVAALVGGFEAESNIDPSRQNSIGALGLAQWLGPRKQLLLSKSDPYSLNTQLNFVIEELNGGESQAGKKLKNSTTIEEAIAAAAYYERFEGITIRDGVTYEEVEVAFGEAGRIRKARNLLLRIKAGEFSNQPSSSQTTTAKTIAQDIRKATNLAGTNEYKLENAIRKIKNINTFKEVNKIINIQNILNEELGFADASTANTIKNYLNTIGIKMEFQTNRLGTVSNIVIKY